MTTFIDTSVLIDVARDDAEHHDWSVEQLNDARSRGPVVVSDIVYCEFAVTLPEQGQLMRQLAG